MPAIATEVVIIILLIVANGVLSMSEIALVTARKARLHQWADEGDRGARLALDIANSPNDFLSTVQVGITLVGIITGAFGGATIARELADHLKHIPAVAAYADALAFAVVVALITYFSLIVGELVPKRIGLHSAERISRTMAAPMQLVSWFAKPIVILLSGSTNLALHVLGIGQQSALPVTEAEIQVLVEQATEAGVFEQAEQEMLASVLKLGDRKVGSIMTPRTDVVWIDVNTSVQELHELVKTSLHDRFPVADQSLDHILGVVDSKAIMRRLIEGKPVEFGALMYQPVYVPENTTALELLEHFRGISQHVAIVMDEYGGVQGLVSGDDLFEAIVGDLPARDGVPKWEAHQRDDKSWLLDGSMPLGQFRELFDMAPFPSDDHADYHTLAGFILFHLQKIPDPGQYFEWQGLRFEVILMDRHRIDKVLVQRVDRK